MEQDKFFLFLILAILLFSLLDPFILAAERGLEVEYPKLDGEEITATTTLPEYVKYIFKFSLIIAAVLAFAILIYGGFRYLTSAGSPETMREAKSWMFGGILGLVLLLCSYLILTTINPELISPKEPEIGPTEGIYLINAEDKKLYYIQDTPEIPKDFNPAKIVFITDKPADPDFADPSKLELDSVFIYPRKNWRGNPTKITNGGAWTTSSDSVISSLKSFKFLWHRAGIYLYDQEDGWELNSNFWPRIFQSSGENLGDFDNKAKSLRIVNPCSSPPCSPGAFDYYVALFEHISFNRRITRWSASGKCQFFLSSTGNLNGYGYVKGKVSSIAVIRKAPIHGEIIFYEGKGCTGEKKIICYLPSFTCVTSPNEIDESDPAGFTTVSETEVLADVKEWNSVYIGANVTLVLNTKEDASGYCAAWSGRQCIPDLEGTTVYSYPGYWPGYRPKRAAWFPLAE